MRFSHFTWLLSQPPLPLLLLISALAWGLLWAGGHDHHAHPVPPPEQVINQAAPTAAGDMHAAHRHAGHQHAAHQPPHTDEPAKLNWQLLTQLLGWMLMVVAMMFPLLHNALRHIWQRSLPRLRPLGVTLFCAVYLLLWAGIGLLCHAVILALQQLPSWQVFSTALLVVLLWQASPLKQRALNYCHYTQRLALTGPAYVYDCCRFALKKSCWCIVSCWHLMLYPMLLPSFSLMFAAMLLVCVWMFIEQHLPPRPPRWCWPFRPEQLLATMRQRHVTLANADIK